MVDWDIKVPHALSAVEIHGEDSVRTGLCHDVGSELGGDGLSALRLSVGASVPKVRQNGGDGPGGCSSASVYGDEELHKVVVDRRAAGLDEKDVTATDGFSDLDVDFSISESFDSDLAEV